VTRVMVRLLIFSFFLASTGEIAALSLSPETSQIQKTVATKAARQFAGATALATCLATTPLPTAALSLPLNNPSSSRGVTVDVKVDSPSEIFRLLSDHRNELNAAYETIRTASTAVSNELKDFVPPDTILVKPPADWKGAARDALSGKGKVLVNGKPVYVAVESETGSLTFTIASPVLPKVPFLDPVTVDAGDNNDIGIDSNVGITPAPEIKKVGFWGREISLPSFTLGDREYDYSVTYGQSAVGSLVGVAGSYGASYSYYLSEQKKEEEAAAAKKKALAEKKKSLSAKKNEATAEKSKATSTKKETLASSERPLKKMLKKNAATSKSEVTSSDVAVPVKKEDDRKTPWSAITEDSVAVLAENETLVVTVREDLAKSSKSDETLSIDSLYNNAAKQEQISDSKVNAHLSTDGPARGRRLKRWLGLRRAT